MITRKIIAALALCLVSSTAIAFNALFLKDSPVANFSPEDTSMMMDNLMSAMDNNDNGVVTEWKNEATGNFGSIMPLDLTEEGDTTCRHVVIENNADGQHGKSEFKLCKAADGKWLVAQDDA